MSKATTTTLPSEAEMNSLTAAQWFEVVRSQATRIETLEHRLAWFERQLFGSKSERLSVLENPHQLALAEVLSGHSEATPTKVRTVAAHTRRMREDDVGEAESVPFFDETRVPVETIRVPNPQARDLAADQYEVISQKVTYRLAQRPGSYVMLKYVREVIKVRESQAIHCPPAPAGVLEGSRADVSFLVGLLVDKFCYHNPLYRQHQRLQDSGIHVSRPWLTQLTQQATGLLEPIYDSQLASIRCSRVIAMDETPIKAGRSGHGKMKTGYFWPIYGEHDEVCFPFFPSRGSEHVRTALGLLSPGHVLLTDGYAAYEKYAKKLEIAHAQCWVHCRRTFFEALQADPDAIEEALKQIAALYKIEDQIKEQNLAGERKRQHRLTHSKPKVEAFFDWIDRQFERQGLLPSSPLTQALGYARERRVGLEVFLQDPDVPMDTNHLERALRVIPMGRRNWLFTWTELGAKHVGIVQSLLTTCRLHEINPYDYLVDVLQRVGSHPAARVAELTPRVWKQHFVAAPLRSDLYSCATDKTIRNDLSLLRPVA
jgi:transposase